ncbi:MAG: ATP-binding protein [Terriglobia bacterium]
MTKAGSEKSPRQTRPLRLLYVEDSPADVELCLRELKKAGLEARADVVQTPEEFAHRVRSRPYDVVLADYKLPEWTGLDALAALQALGKDIPFILVTGMLGEETAVECIKKGATDYVLKDRLARLPVAVRRALEEKALRQERSRAQQRLEERTAYLSALIENSPLGIVVIDPQYRVKMCNPAFERLFLYRQAETVGRTIDEFIAPPEFRPEADESTRRVCAGETVHIITRRRRKDGTLVDVEFHGVPLRWDGKMIGGYGLYQDITERKRAETERARALHLQAENEALARADQMKSEFLADMSHELRTPLNSVIGFSELLLESTGNSLTPGQREDLSMIHQQAQHLLEVANDLLDLAQIESGIVLLDCSFLPVRDLMLRTLDAFAPRLGEKKLEHSVSVDPPDLTVYADARRLEEILTNLIANAIRFTPQGRIALWGRGGDQQVQLCVEDTGIGIEPEDLPHIFDKFYQAHRVAEGMRGGTGLGLAITKQLVELHGGSIWVESTPGAGSRFLLSLPSAPLPASSGGGGKG